MPWSSQNGNNGGWKSGGGGGDGPWGPRSKGGGGGQQPDIEELFKKSQDRLKRAMPGGGKGGGGSFGGPLFYLFLAGLVAIVGFFAFTVRVNPNEVGIVTQFGKYSRTLTEGLHPRLPAPVEQVYLVQPQFAQQVSVGGGGDFSQRAGRGLTTDERNASLMLTGDNNIVDVQFTVQWNIKDAKAFLFNVENPAKSVREVAESAMRQVVGQKTLNDVLNETFSQNQTEVEDVMQKTLDSYNSGINILVVLIGKPDVPGEVVQAVNDVEAAKQDKSRLEQEARAYINKVVPEARGAAAKITEDAEAYKNRIVAEAEGEADRFKQIYTEYSKAPEVTQQRLYLEMMERVLSGTDKIILDNDNKNGGGVVPYLPLNELNRKSTQ